jgi:hypothetical protein
MPKFANKRLPLLLIWLCRQLLEAQGRQLGVRHGWQLVRDLQQHRQQQQHQHQH